MRTRSKSKKKNMIRTIDQYNLEQCCLWWAVNMLPPSESTCPVFSGPLEIAYFDPRIAMLAFKFLLTLL